MIKEIYIIRYSHGSYSDSSDHIFHAYEDKELAQKVVEAFTSLGEWLDAKYNEYHTTVYPFINNWDKENPTPVMPDECKVVLKKTRNPIWNKMSEKDWISFRDNYYTKYVNPYTKLCNEHYAKRNEALETHKKEWFSNLKPIEFEEYWEDFIKDIGQSNNDFYVDTIPLHLK